MRVALFITETLFAAPTANLKSRIYITREVQYDT